MVAAAANNEEKSTCAQCGLPKSRRAYTDNDWIRGANGERKCLFSGSGKSDDEDCVSLIGHLGGCVSGIGYGIVGMVLLVFYLKFTLNPRFDRVRTYNKAVASWQEGLPMNTRQTGRQTLLSFRRCIWNRRWKMMISQ